MPDIATSQADNRLGEVSDEVGRFSVEIDRSDSESRGLRDELKSERTNLG